MIENIGPKDWQQTRGTYTPAKKIDLGIAIYYLFLDNKQEKVKTMRHLLTTLHYRLNLFLSN